MASRISKKAINFVLETLEDINSRSTGEWEASRKHKNKQANNILKSKADEVELHWQDIQD
jgi:hypothetical protein